MRVKEGKGGRKYEITGGETSELKRRSIVSRSRKERNHLPLEHQFYRGQGSLCSFLTEGGSVGNSTVTAPIQVTQRWKECPRGSWSWGGGHAMKDTYAHESP